MADFNSDPYNLGAGPNAGEMAATQATRDSVKASPGFDENKDPYGLGNAPVTPEVSKTDPYGLKDQKKTEKNLVAQLGEGIGQFVMDIAKAPPTALKAAGRDLGNFAFMVRAQGPVNAARSWAAEFRAKAGVPVTPEEEKSLALSLAAYKAARPNDPIVQHAEEVLKSVTTLTPEEKHQLNRGLGDIVSIQAGGLIKAGVGAAAGLIPNVLVRKIAAIEAHSIATLVVYDVSNTIANEEQVTAQRLAGDVALGAALPGIGKIAGGTAGALVKGGAAATKATVGPAAAALDKALAHIKLYTAVTDMVKQANDAVFISGEGLLRKYGLGETADRLVALRGQRHILGAKWNTRVAASMRGLSKEDQNLVGTLLHEDQVTPELLQRAENPELVQKAVGEVQSVLTRVGSLAEQAQLVVGDSESGTLYHFVRRKDFGMPHILVNTERFMEDGKLRTEALDAIQKTLTKEGWKPSITGETLESHAKDVLERIHLRASGEYEEAVQKFGKKFSGTVQVWGRHYNLPGYHLNPADVLPTYLERMSRNITQAMEFGPEQGAAITGRTPKDIFPQAFAELEKITDQDTKNRLEAVITRQLGSGFKEPSGRAKRTITSLQQFQAVTKLGLAQIAQLAQLITPNLQVGFKGAAKDFFRLMSKDPALQDNLLRTGSFTQSLVREAEERMFSGGKDGVFDVAKVLQRTGFTGLDTLARKYGALRGWTFASHQAEEAFKLTQRLQKAGGLERTYIQGQLKKIEAKLVDLGVDTAALYKRGGILTPDEFLKAGQKVSTDWNFWGDSLSLPVFWNSPAGRVLTQFKSFAYQQSIALKKHVVKPALDGDLGPLTRLLVAGQIGGEIINDMRALARNKPRNDQKRIFDNYAALGLLSIWGDTMQAAEKKDWIGGFVAGPTGSDVLEAATALTEAIHGKPKRAVKFAIQHVGPMVPVVGPLATPAITNALYPPATPKGQ